MKPEPDQEGGVLTLWRCPECAYVDDSATCYRADHGVVKSEPLHVIPLEPLREWAANNLPPQYLALFLTYLDSKGEPE